MSALHLLLMHPLASVVFGSVLQERVARVCCRSVCRVRATDVADAPLCLSCVLQCVAGVCCRSVLWTRVAVLCCKSEFFAECIAVCVAVCGAVCVAECVAVLRCKSQCPARALMQLKPPIAWVVCCSVL